MRRAEDAGSALGIASREDDRSTRHIHCCHAGFVRRFSAAVGIVLVLTLSLLLLYRVWVHHHEMELRSDDGSLVEVVAAPFASEKFTQLSC